MTTLDTGTGSAPAATVSAAKAGAPVIRTRDVHKSYGDVRAVDGVSFEVFQGEVYVLSLTPHSQAGVQECCQTEGDRFQLWFHAGFSSLPETKQDSFQHFMLETRAMGHLIS